MNYTELGKRTYKEWLAHDDFTITKSQRDGMSDQDAVSFKEGVLSHRKKTREPHGDEAVYREVLKSIQNRVG